MPEHPRSVCAAIVVTGSLEFLLVYTARTRLGLVSLTFTSMRAPAGIESRGAIYPQVRRRAFLKVTGAS
jgi:hypothetical protein